MKTLIQRLGVCVTLLMLVGCTTMPMSNNGYGGYPIVDNGRMANMGTGAVIGGLLGAIVGNPMKGAMIGGALGGMQSSQNGYNPNAYPMYQPYTTYRPPYVGNVPYYEAQRQYQQSYYGYQDSCKTRYDERIQAIESAFQDKNIEIQQYQYTTADESGAVNMAQDLVARREKALLDAKTSYASCIRR